MRSREEIHEVATVRTAAHHIEVEVALHVLHVLIVVGEVARTEQSELLAVPECEHDSALRRCATRHESLHYLQHCSHARRIVVGSVVYLVAFEVAVHALMVEMCTHNNHFIGLLARQHREHIAKVHRAVHLLLYLRNRVSLNEVAHATLQLLHSASLERLLIRLEERLQTCLAHLRDDILLGDARATLACTTALQEVVGEEIDMRTSRILGDGTQAGITLRSQLFLHFRRLLLSGFNSSRTAKNDSSRQQ